MRAIAGFILFISILVVLVSAARADIYQYVDDSGVVHFTNVPVERIRKKTKIRVESHSRRHGKAESARMQPEDRRGSAEADEVPASYQSIINAACERYGVDPSLVQAIVKVESDFNPFAVSRKGAMGLMQLMPETAATLNIKNILSPAENIEGGVRYLRYLLDRYEGNLSLALAAYNSGETSVQRWGTIPPFKETQEYVKKILQLYNGSGQVFAPHYTIYVGMGEDGTLLLTDNPSNHPNQKLHRKMGHNL